jgi:hypothetical protein
MRKSLASTTKPYPHSELYAMLASLRTRPS